MTYGPPSSSSSFLGESQNSIFSNLLRFSVISDVKQTKNYDKNSRQYIEKLTVLFSHLTSISLSVGIIFTQSLFITLKDWEQLQAHIHQDSESAGKIKVPFSWLAIANRFQIHEPIDQLGLHNTDQLDVHYIYMSGIGWGRPFPKQYDSRLRVLIKGNFNFWYKEMGIYVWGRQMTVHMCSRVFPKLF